MRRRTRRTRQRDRALLPPEHLDGDGVALRRLTVEDAPALSRAATESLEHLAPWMPWATPEGTSLEAQRQRLLGPATLWSSSSGYEYGMFLPDGSMVGGCGLHRRIGPRALEIGYWVHVDHTRKGLATASVGALTGIGFALRGIERMEIHCDEANRASAAVPPKLGYHLNGRVAHPPEAPGETGTRLIWVLYRRESEARSPSPSSPDPRTTEP
ncbi:MAG TPA: GNAT family N-acetyltransferase [Acidimicrobiales bacterium]|nr:GNAT family N-acetyltransferase [Acidimicrobiales bacterium]